ncbi:MAG: acyl carrier protein [Gammaproteobacteria bacterium]|nr:acyl carrier protein [Gammaproteobacteria bacterium]
MDHLTTLFSEVLGIEASQLNDDTSPDNLFNWDSMAAMSLVIAIEEAFSVELSTSEIVNMRSIGFARAVLRKKGVEGI